MDSERIRNAAHGKRSSGIEARMNRRIRTYVVLIVILGGWYLFSEDKEPALRLADRSLDPVNVPAAIEAEPLAVVDVAKLADVRDATAAERARVEPEALQHLLRQAGRLIYGDLDKLGQQRGDWEELVRRGVDLRGQPFDVLGTLRWFEQELIDGYLQVWCEVEDLDGRSWAFVAVTEPYALTVGQVVHVGGFFMKAHELLRPDGSQTTAPLLIGDEILPSDFPIDAVTELDLDLIAGVRDRTIAQASAPLESPPLWHLLSYTATVDDDTYFAAGPPGEVLPTELLQHPDAWRSTPVSVTGVLYYMTETPLGPRGENPLGIPFGWDLWVSDNRAGGTGTMRMLTLDKPADVQAGDIVTVTGLFFRRYAFENKRGQPHMASVLVPRTVTRFVPAPNTLSPVLLNIVIGLVAVIVSLIAFAQWKDGKRAKGARSQRMRRHRGNVARPGLLGGETAGASSNDAAPGGMSTSDAAAIEPPAPGTPAPDAPA